MYELEKIALDENNKFVKLQAAVNSMFPHCDDAQKRGAFVPHLTAGQCQNTGEVASSIQEAEWSPRAFFVGDVCLMHRDGPDQPFVVHCRVSQFQ